MNNEKRINNLSELLSTVKADTSSWTHTGFAKPWFRGHTNTKYTLLPSILRKGNEANEFEITTKFRLLAPGYIEVPETGRLDQWLFLMQHHRLPTRLLDWTENPLYAALFATTKAFDTEKEIENDAAIYCIDPIALNHLSGFDYFPNTWTQTSVLQTIKFAFGTQNDPVNGQKIMYLENPVAIYPSTIHSRIKSQRGCFTLHGNNKRDLEQILGQELSRKRRLVKYIIPKEIIPSFLKDLYDIGITYATLFLDLEGLSRDLKYQFSIKGC